MRTIMARPTARRQGWGRSGAGGGGAEQGRQAQRAAWVVGRAPQPAVRGGVRLVLPRELLARRAGVEVFDPGTANTLMAALLVHDLSAGSPRQEFPWQDEAYAAAHGGLWRAAYDPRSALGLAALLGAASART